MSRILIVEDDRSILSGLVMNLQMEGHTVVTATDGEDGYKVLNSEKPELAIFDVMLPKRNGFELCRMAREAGLAIPILLLTARGEEGDRVRGLDLGADDYVTKPFSLPELLARVRALLRRNGRESKAVLLEELTFDDVVIDFREFSAERAGKRVEMAPKEYGLLRVLASRPGQVMTRDELLNLVWGYDSYPSTRTVDNHVMLLRSKLGVRHIQTVHAVGYKWEQTNP